jgi:hypothetical protein
MLKDAIKKRKKLPELTYQTCNPSHKTEITSKKENKKKLRSLISNQPNIEG